MSASGVSRATITRMVASGLLIRLLPGVYCLAECVTNLPTLLHAVPQWSPDAVITGRAAARLGFWSGTTVETVDVAHSSQAQLSSRYALHRETVPLHHIVEREGLRISDPAWTAVWLSRTDGGEALDSALRARAITQETMNEAMRDMAGRHGAKTRRELVSWSVHDPWSIMERRLHRILADAGIRGWHGNWWYVPPDPQGGPGWPVDVAFPKQKVALETHGWEFHQAKSVWKRDLLKSNAMQLDGWTVLSFTWQDLERPEWVVAQVRAALALHEGR